MKVYYPVAKVKFFKEEIMNTKLLSAAVIALALSACDSKREKAEMFAGTKIADGSSDRQHMCSDKFPASQKVNYNSDDMTIGRVVGKYGYSDGTATLNMYLMIDTNGDETAEYVGRIADANNSLIVGVAHNAEVVRQEKTIAQWRSMLIDFEKIPQARQEKTR